MKKKLTIIAMILFATVVSKVIHFVNAVDFSSRKGFLTINDQSYYAVNFQSYADSYINTEKRDIPHKNIIIAGVIGITPSDSVKNIGESIANFVTPGGVISSIQSNGSLIFPKHNYPRVSVYFSKSIEERYNKIECKRYKNVFINFFNSCPVLLYGTLKMHRTGTAITGGSDSYYLDVDGFFINNQLDNLDQWEHTSDNLTEILDDDFVKNMVKSE
jgi:hypothetical protein